ncbi:ImmA/IrrE family metallo-endopeptidase [Thiothrix unzii]|jgi:Zn-dependent peptidase ImmA (M78 family)|uniref:ImmA/IrrE family metallo-endopeptidase n=1 Tax=Thiothrix unzii TaxID=111769 RepID=UPI002A359271|nr:ImmA/IrrE family metallo-endopeptidase [Thiothrix unzii]MDX9987044.1 ImmA/IrrE family metallo-endopeptidase [Thiothrix unzii]
MIRVQREAEELAKELDIPIQIDDVCKILSDDEFHISYEEKDISSKGFEGISLGNNQAAGIIVNSNIDSPTRKRFTAMHEIGHVVLHIFPGVETAFHCTKKDLSIEKNSKQSYENEANTFASSLLLPKHFVEPLVYKNDLTWDFIKEVADKCEASLQATARRLVTLAKEEYSLLIQYNSDVWLPIKSPPCHHFIERSRFPSHLTRTEIVNDKNFPHSWDECEASEWIACKKPYLAIKYSSIHYPKHKLTMTMLYFHEIDDWQEDDEWKHPHF